MGSRTTIPLTSKMKVQTGSHILYFSSNTECYINNLLSFIRMGIDLGQYVILIDNYARYCEMMEKLVHDYSPEVLANFVHFLDHDEFYRTYEHFHYERVLDNMGEAIKPYIEHKRDVRLWGHVYWKDHHQIDMVSKLDCYESEADLTLSELGFLTVCAYDAPVVPASIQNVLMKSHEYFMTDEELVFSSLYRHRKNHPSSFPTLSAQMELETEMDLYKQKLDFVHVVSHEVRNPLTVIKAYAKIVKNRVTEERDRERLQAINDYVDLIDNEITHIINTEEMLTSDALWRRRLVSPKELLHEVIGVMKIKARTQNIEFQSESALTGVEMVLANSIGFKLVVSNIISNAIKYSEEGGLVQCRADVTQGQLVVTVQDFGIGMSEEQVGKLFQKYGKMNETKGGQGIGLFMVKKLIDHFEGSIEVSSVLGSGTMVQVTFPLRSVVTA